MRGGDHWRGAIYARVTDRKQRGEFFSGERFGHEAIMARFDNSVCAILHT